MSALKIEKVPVGTRRCDDAGWRTSLCETLSKLKVGESVVVPDGPGRSSNISVILTVAGYVLERKFAQKRTAERNFRIGRVA